MAAGRALSWLVGLPLLDRALTAALRWPRAAATAGAALGLALSLAALLPLLPVTSVPASATGLAGLAADTTPTPPDRLDTQEALAEQEVLAVVAGYNQASISAGLLGRTDLLAPYLDGQGAAWRQVQAEYARRAQRGETSDATLARWGVLRIVVTGGTALVETKEQWDVITSVGPTVISSRRGVLVRNSYQLHRTPDGVWQIRSVDTTPVMG